MSNAHHNVKVIEGMFSWLASSSRVARTAGVLQSLGIRQAQRFGFVSRNSFRKVELMQGGDKIPRRQVFLGELPKSATNKVLIHQLRRSYGGQG